MSIQRTFTGMALTAALIASSMLSSLPVQATPTTDLITPQVISDIRQWADTEIVKIAIAAQNVRHNGISQNEIDALDKRWRAEREEDAQPLIAQLFGSPLSNYLTQVQAGSLGLYTEIFAMDYVGLNVGQSAITSDYWQGDEGKFQKTYPVGAETVFVDEAELHEGSGTYRAQVNLSISDGNGTAIGAMTVEVNLTELARRAQWASAGGQQ